MLSFDESNRSTPGFSVNISARITYTGWVVTSIQCYHDYNDDDNDNDNDDNDDDDDVGRTNRAAALNELPFDDCSQRLMFYRLNYAVHHVE